MNGYVQLRRGLYQHLQDGRLTLQEFAAFGVILGLADKASGIWIGSARALAAICGAGDISERQARHLLESLERKGYIKRFPTRRSHANYPILVNRYLVTFGAYSKMTLNALATTDYRHPVYENCLEDVEDDTGEAKKQALPRLEESESKPEQSTTCDEQPAQLCLEHGLEHGVENASSQELRSEKGEKRFEEKDMVGALLAPTPQPDPTITLPLNDGTEYPILPGQVAEWSELYPSVDVPQALRSMRGWLGAHRERRKTKAGILRFVVAWLGREQDRGGQPGRSEARGIMKHAGPGAGPRTFDQIRRDETDGAIGRVLERLTGKRREVPVIDVEGD